MCIMLVIPKHYSRKTGHKKKVSSVVHFPDVIDMTNYVTNPEVPPSSLIYDLSAVLIHRGPSAYSGHYMGRKFSMTSFQRIQYFQ